MTTDKSIEYVLPGALTANVAAAKTAYNLDVIMARITAAAQPKFWTTQFIPDPASPGPPPGGSLFVYLREDLTPTEKASVDAIITSYVYTPPPRTQFTPASYDALVSPIPGAGDYTSIAAAFAAGAKTVYAKIGVYMETSNIVIPNSGFLYGESLGGVVIHFGGGARSVVCDGWGGVTPAEAVGTITVATNSTNVVGVGTNFTSFFPGWFIEIGGKVCPIAAITDDTHLTLVTAYRGRALVDSPTCIQPTFTGCHLRNIFVVASAAPAFIFRAIRNGTISNIGSDSCVKTLYMDECCDINVSSVVSMNSFTTGIEISDSNSIAVSVVSCTNSVSHGLHITDDCKSLTITALTCENNGGMGIYVEHVTAITIHQGIFRGNAAGGAHAGPFALKTTFSNCDAGFNGGYGFWLNSSNQANITSCHANENASHGIYVSGLTGAQIITTTACNNGDSGIVFDAVVNLIANGNIACDNVVDGMVLTGACEAGVLSDNVVRGNVSGNAFVINADVRQAVVSHNLIQGAVTVDPAAAATVDVNDNNTISV